MGNVTSEIEKYFEKDVFLAKKLYLRNVNLKQRDLLKNRIK